VGAGGEEPFELVPQDPVFGRNARTGFKILNTGKEIKKIIERTKTKKVHKKCLFIRAILEISILTFLIVTFALLNSLGFLRVLSSSVKELFLIEITILYSSCIICFKILVL